jgi:hypothetical protein
LQGSKARHGKRDGMKTLGRGNTEIQSSLDWAQQPGKLKRKFLLFALT